MQLAVCASEVGFTVGECFVGSVLCAKLESGWGEGQREVQGNAFGQNQDLDFPNVVGSTSLSVCVSFILPAFISSLFLFPCCWCAPPFPINLLFSAFSLLFILALRFFFSHFPCVVLISSSLCVYLSVFLPLFTFLGAGSPSGVSAELTLWILGLAVFAEIVVFQPEETFSPGSQ